MADIAQIVSSNTIITTTVIILTVVLAGVLSHKFSTKKQGKNLPFPSPIQVDIDEYGVAIVKLNRPRKKNAITEAMYIEVTSVLKMLSGKQEVKCILLTGSGDYFSSGNDLSNFSKLMHPLDIAKRSAVILLNFVDSFITCEKPIIVAVNGPAIGIAVTILGVCDRIFCSESASFVTPFASLGMAPEGCSSYTFPRLMGKETADEVLWKGRKLSAKEALSCGLVQSIHPPSETLQAALQYCHDSICSSRDHGKVGIEATPLSRRIVREGIVEELQRANKEECDVLGRKWISKECFAALAKYLESRNMRLAAYFLR
jgi:peroxisomal 3,2-trans-enoyl-CoA isomerase